MSAEEKARSNQEVLKLANCLYEAASKVLYYVAWRSPDGQFNWQDCSREELAKRVGDVLHIADKLEGICNEIEIKKIS